MTGNASDAMQGPGWRIEYLPNGAYGWAEQWDVAQGLAHFASMKLLKRHRVYWSSRGNCWMIRRAFMLGALTDDGRAEASR